MRAIWFILKLPLKILMAPVILSLTLFVWICVGIVYVSGLVLGLISMVVALLGVAVLITYSLQNGIILLVIAFLISPYGLPMAAIWLSSFSSISFNSTSTCLRRLLSPSSLHGKKNWSTEMSSKVVMR